MVLPPPLLCACMRVHVCVCVMCVCARARACWYKLWSEVSLGCHSPSFILFFELAFCIWPEVHKVGYTCWPQALDPASSLWNH